MKASWKKHTLNFKAPSGTSRGVLRSKDSYFLLLEHLGKKGIGECGLLKGLSIDDRPDYEETLNRLILSIDKPFEVLYKEFREFPSIQFGLEMALLDLNSDDHVLIPSKFTSGVDNQPINGLIWMGDDAFMRQQLKQRLKEGFSVIKMKIGAIDFEEEIRILNKIRSEFDAQTIEIRMDANGAFKPEEAMPVLHRLAELDIHSIEQPIKKGQWQEMASLCEQTPIPIALDEELIGIFDTDQKRRLIETIKPQFAILKPSFIGGFKGSEEWISILKNQTIGWWLTSALESNIGLSAIAQWNYTLKNSMPSGLGTGSLYTNNFGSPLFVEEGKIAYDPRKAWEIGL